jgi:hypothetical protein
MSVRLNFFGELAELAEGARLERGYMGNCIEGSNPSLSAIYFLLSSEFEPPPKNGHSL